MYKRPLGGWEQAQARGLGRTYGVAQEGGSEIVIRRIYVIQRKRRIVPSVAGRRDGPTYTS
eukprot:1537676-Pleurochrysis_carterae.AAC.1